MGLLNDRVLIKTITKILKPENITPAYKSYQGVNNFIKNNNDILPLTKDKSILLIGPAANDLNVLNGALDSYVAGN